VTSSRPLLAIALSLVLANTLIVPSAKAPVVSTHPEPAASAAVVDSAPPGSAFLAVPAVASTADPVGDGNAEPVVLRVAQGDTLIGLLVEAGVVPGEAQEAIDSLKRVWDPRELKPGQEIVLGFAEARLEQLSLSAALDHDVIVARAGDGHFAARARPRRLNRELEFASGVIRTSLFEAASDAQVPTPILAEMIRAFSYDVDFQREVQPADRFDLLFERLYDDGKAVGVGNVVYAALTLRGKTLRVYRYTATGAKAADFFNEHGQSVRKALLRTPIDGARLSSGFGMREHPILGFTLMHPGVDFAAPTGTPVMAAGDGIVEIAGWGGSYGNLVLLRHDAGYETAYAHMSFLVRGIRPGEHVHQGEVIGYVGATGRATGPHLHYEVRIRGQRVNPISVKMQPGQRLAGQEFIAFRAVAEAIDHRLPAMQEGAAAAGSAREGE
jgi:murein DD-endopeptidase MepM/ murein hydrolase activator NlpD